MRDASSFVPSLRILSFRVIVSLAISWNDGSYALIRNSHEGTQTDFLFKSLIILSTGRALFYIAVISSMIV